ncbi:chitin synthase-domain-containing protein [Infundibulicybe gibba]|nr:chitin synthase-domain-containing protein [Infundibulicybe gibba]
MPTPMDFYNEPIPKSILRVQHSQAKPPSRTYSNAVNALLKGRVQHKLPLKNGNLVINCSVPSQIADRGLEYAHAVHNYSYAKTIEGIPVLSHFPSFPTPTLSSSNSSASAGPGWEDVDSDSSDEELPEACEGSPMADHRAGVEDKRREEAISEEAAGHHAVEDQRHEEAMSKEAAEWRNEREVEKAEREVEGKRPYPKVEVNKPYQEVGENGPPRGATALPEDGPGGTVEFERLERAPTPKFDYVIAGPEPELPFHVSKPVKMEEERNEFNTLTYQAVTCDPDEFVQGGYRLRPNIYNRDTELFIVMTMYNEEASLFLRTMNSVIRNIVHLSSMGNSKKWGEEPWKKIVVCIVSDGRAKVHKETLQALQVMGCYQEGVAVSSVNQEKVTAHIFEISSRKVASESGDSFDSQYPMQIIFCLKEANQGKINSHRWFFNAFSQVLKPKVCILLDVGTRPTNKSLYQLWKAFDERENVGGACGEIYVDCGRECSAILQNPLVASQNFEYKISNILDKPFESNFGFISVLPGAFSAYRYQAIIGDPLDAYFKGDRSRSMGEDPLANVTGLFERNKFLAEDRILCFEIVVKQKEGWILHYVRGAKASTDVPTTVPEFIYQRRRWLNGSLFASAYAITSWKRIWTSGHTTQRKICLSIEFLYMGIQLVFAWTSLANFYLAFYFLVSSAVENPETDAFNFIRAGSGPAIFDFFLKIYVALLFAVTFCSLGNRPGNYKSTYLSAIVLFGICQIITSWCVWYTVYLAIAHNNLPHPMQTSATFYDISISLLTTYGLYMTTSFVFQDPWHMFTSFLQYLFFLPSYVNVLTIYAMANLNDVSWGTKTGGVADEAPKLRDVVTTNDSKEEEPVVEVPLPAKLSIINAVYRAAESSLAAALKAPPKPPPDMSAQLIQDQNTRSDVVLKWLFVNMMVILVFTSPALIGVSSKVTKKANFNPYLSLLFNLLAVLAAVRFAGSVYYLYSNQKIREDGDDD